MTGPALSWLAPEECLELLAGQQVGRLGYWTGASPDILPVNYAMDGDTVIFATAAGSKLMGIDRAPVVFEIDDIDPATRTGWSVVVHGSAHEVTSFDAHRLLERTRAAAAESWTQGAKPHLVRIRPKTISGRRITHPSTAEAGASASS